MHVLFSSKALCRFAQGNTLDCSLFAKWPNGLQNMDTSTIPSPQHVQLKNESGITARCGFSTWNRFLLLALLKTDVAKTFFFYQYISMCKVELVEQHFKKTALAAAPHRDKTMHMCYFVSPSSCSNSAVFLEVKHLAVTYSMNRHKPFRSLRGVCLIEYDMQKIYRKARVTVCVTVTKMNG